MSWTTNKKIHYANKGLTIMNHTLSMFDAMTRTIQDKSVLSKAKDVRNSFTDMISMLQSEAPRIVMAANTKVTDKISWTDFGGLLGIEYDDDKLFHQIADSSFEEAKSWIEEYESDSETQLSEDVKDEIRMAIEQGASDHWSNFNVFSNNIPLEQLVDDANSWSKRGTQMAIYDRELPSGEGIVTWESDWEGVQFTVAEPFLVALAESVYAVLGFADEGYELDDVNAKMVVRTMARIAEAEGRGIDMDLDRWDDRRKGPRYEDLVKIAEGNAPAENMEVAPAEIEEEQK